MADLEVGHFGLVASFGQGFEAVLDELGNATAEDCLLAEEVGFGFFGEGSLDDACAGATDCLGVGQCECKCLAGCVLLDTDEGRNALAFEELTANSVSRALRGDHADVVASFGGDIAVADVEAVREEQCGVVLEVRRDLLCVDETLDLVGHQDHHNVAFGHSFGNVFDGQASGFSLVP